jgi:hypothetical protein
MVFLPLIYKIYRTRELLWKPKEIVRSVRIREEGVEIFAGLILEEELCLETGVVPASASVTRLSLKRGNDWLQATRGFAH